MKARAITDEVAKKRREALEMARGARFWMNLRTSLGKPCWQRRHSELLVRNSGMLKTPMGVVILGGLLSSTALNMLVVPALYARFGRSKTQQDIGRRTATMTTSAERRP